MAFGSIVPRSGELAQQSMAKPPLDTRHLVKRWLLFLILLILGFAKPLFDLVRFAARSDLYSHILLIPFISIYLARQEKGFFKGNSSPSLGGALLTFLAGAAVLGGYWFCRHSGWKPQAEDYLAVMNLSFLLLLLSGTLLILGREPAKRLCWPLGFLVFLIPLPVVAMQGIEAFLQITSAVTASGFLEGTGLPVFRDGTMLQLPGFSMRVAPECSGIHSTLVLFISSVLAARLFLNRAWSRVALVLAVVPLGIIRNGLRVWSLGQLCVRLDPDWIDSAYHHHGGPVWFMLSLVPLFLLLLWLMKVERRGRLVSLPKNR